jgi:hypothetical protein
MSILSDIADGATIVTALTAGGAAFYFWYQRRERMRRLERYLEKAKRDYDSGGYGGETFRVSHLTANCLMTEAQIFEAALISSKVRPWVVTKEEGGDTDKVVFSFDPNGRARQDAASN